MKKMAAVMVYGFGTLGIITSLFFYTQPSEFGTFLQNSYIALYDFLLYYFIISGGISFVIVVVGVCMCIAKKLSFRHSAPGLLLNGMALACYLVFGLLG